MLCCMDSRDKDGMDVGQVTIDALYLRRREVVTTAKEAFFKP